MSSLIKLGQLSTCLATATHLRRVYGAVLEITTGWFCCQCCVGESDMKV